MKPKSAVGGPGPQPQISLFIWGFRNCLLDYNLLNWGTDLKKEVFVQDGTQDNEEMSDRSANTEAEDGLVDEEDDIKNHLRTMAEQKNWIKVTSMLALLLLWSTRGWLTLSSLSPFSPFHLSCLFHLRRCFYKPFSPCLIFSDNQGLMDISLLTANANQLRQAFDQCEPFRSDVSVVKWHICVDIY